MEDLIESVTRGNPTEVKVVLASVVMALAVYQLMLIAIGYEKLRLPFLRPIAASRSHRAVGDTILVLVIIVALMCIGYFGFEDEGGVHAIAGGALIFALALKVAAVRNRLGLQRFLPALGLSVWLLIAVVWLTSAGDFLVNGGD